MADDRGLDGFDPYDLQDVESERIGAWFDHLDDDGLQVASACEGWTRRDLLGHLVAVEDYHRACLEGTVSELIEPYLSRGATSLDEINQAAVDDLAQIGAADLLTTWRDRNQHSRAGFRAADGTNIDTSIGSYPGRYQAFHVASELGIHADDAGAPVDEAERAERERWLAGVARFALTEVREDASVEPTDDGYRVSRGGTEMTFDTGAFVAGMFGRAAPGQLTSAGSELLSLSD